MNQVQIEGAGGLQLNALDTGRRSGRPILFIHGWSQSHLCWIKQLESELADDYRLVALDNRGHGMSDAPAEQTCYTDSQLWADDVKAVIDTLELTRPVLVGWSYGGLIITDFVRAHGDGAIAGINFVGAAVRLNEAALGPLIGPGFYDIFPRTISSDLRESVDAMREFVETCFARKLSRADYERVLCWNMVVRPDVRASLAAREVIGDDALAATTVPVLVTHGREDVTVLPAMAEHILATCPTAAAAWYGGVAHAPFIEDPIRFNAELAEFVGAVY